MTILVRMRMGGMRMGGSRPGDSVVILSFRRDEGRGAVERPNIHKAI
jgi:hypothetical protein